jgi:hypothetical protein
VAIASVTESIEDMMAAAFDEAYRRDPQRTRQRVFLVDGNKQQITAIEDHAAEHGLKVLVLIDCIHVSGYIGKAAAALHVGAPVTYLTNNQQHMKYDKALAKGWPIATGMIEGTCRFVIEDRFGITGARWSPDGAKLILKLRAVVVNGDLGDYMNYYKERYGSEHHLACYDEDTIERLDLAA